MVPEHFTDVSPQPRTPRGPSLCDAAIKKSAFHFTISYMYLYDNFFTPLCIIKGNFPFVRRKRVHPPTGFTATYVQRRQHTWRRSLRFHLSALIAIHSPIFAEPEPMCKQLHAGEWDSLMIMCVAYIRPCFPQRKTFRLAPHRPTAQSAAAGEESVCVCVTGMV